MNRWALIFVALAAAAPAWGAEVRLSELLRGEVDEVVFDARSGAIRRFASEPSGRVRYPAFRASTLLGLEVRDRLHRDAGEIVDLVIDTDANRVAYALVDLRDDWQPGRRVVPVPIETFSLTRDLANYVVLNVARERLGN